MKSPESVQYHSPFHREAYDTVGPREVGAELDILIDMLDDITFADTATGIRASQAKSVAGYFECSLNHEYIRGETSYLGLAWPLESISLGVQYCRQTEPFVSQRYKVDFGARVHQTGAEKVWIRTIYDLEKVGSDDNPSLFGLITRPNIVGGSSETEELTAYDCENLAKALDEINVIIRHEKATANTSP